MVKPKVLVTGFSSFPGAPHNPTQDLIAWLQTDGLQKMEAEFCFHLLQTEYRNVERELAAHQRTFMPDIALHFGLSKQSTGFTLERLAHNQIGTKVDMAACVPAQPLIGDIPKLSATLPLAAMHARLTAANLPVAWSDDAGNYVCNFLLYHSLQAAAEAEQASMRGFIHVPLLADQQLLKADEPIHTLTQEQLWNGAVICIETSITEWQARAAGA